MHTYVERGKLRIRVSSVLFPKQSCIRKVKVRYSEKFFSTEMF